MSVISKKSLKALDKNELSEHVYVFLDPSYKVQPCFKIGISSRSPEARLKELNSGRATKLQFVYSTVCYHAHPVEQIVHRLLEEFRVPGTEFFAGIPEHVVVNLVRSIGDLNVAIKKNNGGLFALDDSASSEENDFVPAAPVEAPVVPVVPAAPVEAPVVPVLPAAPIEAPDVPELDRGGGSGDEEVVGEDGAVVQNPADTSALRQSSGFHCITFAPGVSLEAVRNVFVSNTPRRLQRRNPLAALFFELPAGNVVCLFCEGTGASKIQIKHFQDKFLFASISSMDTYGKFCKKLQTMVTPEPARFLGHYRCPNTILKKCNGDH